MKSLERSRADIDHLDAKMASLYTQRMATVRDIAAQKQRAG